MAGVQQRFASPYVDEAFHMAWSRLSVVGHDHRDLLLIRLGACVEGWFGPVRKATAARTQCARRWSPELGHIDEHTPACSQVTRREPRSTHLPKDQRRLDNQE